MLQVSSNPKRTNILDSMKLDQALRVAEQKFKEGTFQQAKEIYESIIEKFPRNKKALQGIKALKLGYGNKVQNPARDKIYNIISLYNAGKYSQAITQINLILKLFPNSDVLYNILGATNVALQQFQIGIENYKKAISINPSNSEAYNNLGNALWNQGNLGKALNNYQQALKIRPNYAEAYYNMGNTLRDQGDLNSAIKSYKEAVRLSPDYAKAYNNLGNALQDQGNLEKAMVNYEQALKFRPNYAEVYNNMGNVLQAQGRFKAAIKKYETAINLSPGDAEAYNNLGNALQDQGNLQDAITSYQQALKIKPNYAEAYNNIGNAKQKKGQLKEAIASYKQAIKIKPDYAESYNNMGNAQKKCGDLKEAIASYKQALKINPDYAEVYTNIGAVFKETGNVNAAIDSYQQALKINPNFVEVHYDLGNTYQAKGEIKIAINHYKRALKINPNHASALHLLDALTGNQTNAPPKDYITKLFDYYAEKFEDSLVRKLEYKIPKILTRIIRNESPVSLGAVLDLGCGTGLVGKELSKYSDYFEGIDLSKSMLEHAKQKNVYDKLSHYDILEYLSSEPLDFDYFIAADVFIYVGALSEVFRLIKTRNNKSGRLIFSTEHTDKDGYSLEISGRYSHSKEYIKELCKNFDYKFDHFETTNLRKEKDNFLKGGIYSLQFSPQKY